MPHGIVNRVKIGVSALKYRFYFNGFDNTHSRYSS